MIPYGKQDIQQSDIDAVNEVLCSQWLTQGPLAGQFEQAVADYCGAEHAVAVNSGTSALHIACLALGLGPDDYLWTTPNTFVASANCGLYCGASVDFVDIDTETWNISVSALRDKLERAEQAGTLPKVLVPVHFAGQSCDMKEIHVLSQQYGFRILEDASHAIGGKYDGRPIGDCRYSDITVFSFHPVKIITTGEGGLALTNDTELARRMRRFSTHGITREPEEMTEGPDGGWYYEQIELGFNYRFTDIQAALGLSQLKRLDEYVEQRNRLAMHYSEALEALPLTVQRINTDCYPAYHLFVIHLSEKNIRDKVFDYMRTQGIGVNVHYIPVHMQPYYRKLGFKPGDFPNAEAYYHGAITLPLYPQLKTEEINQVIECAREAIA